MTGHGLWPDGEPREVRQAYDDGMSTSRDPDPEFRLTDGLTPQQTAELLTRLEQGSKDAWKAAHEVPWLSATYESRFQAANEVDGVFRDAMRDSLATGHRQIGEEPKDITRRLEVPSLGTSAWPPARPHLQAAPERDREAGR